MGEPLTITTTFWAKAGCDNATATAKAAAAARRRMTADDISLTSLSRIGVFIVSWGLARPDSLVGFDCTAWSICPRPNPCGTRDGRVGVATDRSRRYSPRRQPWQDYCSKRHLPGRPCGLLHRGPAGPADGAQAHLQHDRVVGREIAVIREVADVIHAQHVAVVDIAEPDAGLVELARLDVVAQPRRDDPVGVDLVGRDGEHALAAGQEAELGLGGVVAKHHRQPPAIEGRGTLDLEPLQSEIVGVEAKA